MNSNSPQPNLIQQNKILSAIYGAENTVERPSDSLTFHLNLKILNDRKVIQKSQTGSLSPTTCQVPFYMPLTHLFNCTQKTISTYTQKIKKQPIDCTVTTSPSFG